MTTFSETIGRKRARQGRRSSTEATVTQTVLRLRQFGDACLMVIMFMVPLTSACAQEVGIGVFAACSFLMAISWACEQILDPSESSPASGAEIIVFGAIGLVCLQLIPLSASSLQNLAPFSGEYLSLWGTAEGRILGNESWRTISLTPSLTRSGLILLIAYSVFFLTLLQRLKTIGDIERVIRLIAIAAFVMAVLGLLQLRGNGKFLWLLEHPFRSAAWPAKGAFSNPNHFAHFLALGIGPLIWWWHQSTQQKGSVIRGSVRTNGFGLGSSTESQKKFLGAAIAVVLLAGILSVSRGGIVAIAIAGLIAARTVTREWKHLLKLAVPLSVFVGLAAWLAGTEYLQQKWNSVFHAGSVQELLAGRLALWSALWEALPSFWVTGSGLGSHAEIYPTWLEQDFGVRFSHAESGYLQILLELGVGGLFLMLSGICLVSYWTWNAWRRGDQSTRSIVTVLAAGIVAGVLHSFVDFAWYIPGCMVITLTIVACLCRCHQLSHDTKNDSGTQRKLLWPQILAVLLIVLILPLGRLSAEVLIRDAESEYDWNMYRKYSIAANDTITYNSMDSLDDKLDAIIMHLENCLTADPADFRAASFLTVMYVRRFERQQQTSENRMTVREIRDTVRTAEFESPKQVAEWLNRAFGHHASDLYRALSMARKAVKGQPTRGETYLMLSQLGFLGGITEAEEDALLEQAIRLRPHNAAILFVKGLSYVEHGDLDAAMAEWKTAFARDPSILPMIVSGLVPYLPATEIIEKLSPGADGLWLMFVEYRSRDRIDDVKTVVNWHDANLEQLAETSRTACGRFFWQRSYEMFNSVGNRGKAVSSLIKAVEQTPQDYDLRKSLGMELLNSQEKQEALRQLEWCQLRMPDDREITDAIERLTATQAHEVDHER